jgi:predicted nucleic acid-binding protein
MVVGRPYADASALVKLVVTEPESTELRDYLRRQPDPVTSRIATVEVARAVARLTGGRGEDVEALRAVLDRAVVVELDDQLAAAAARIAPQQLRSLDAIHLATALSVRDQVSALITYDIRLADAARDHGLTVLAPA